MLPIEVSNHMAHSYSSITILPNSIIALFLVMHEYKTR